MSRWLPPLRIARRSVLRSPGRSLLIAALVGLPVAAATYADIIWRTFNSPQLTAQQMVGSADAAITITPAPSLSDYDPRWLADHGDAHYEAPQRDPASVGLTGLLPHGSIVAPMPRFLPAELEVGGAIMRTRFLLGDVRQPLQRFVLRLADGSRPPRAGEVLVTGQLARRLHLVDGGGHVRPGAAIALVGGPSAHVAGIARDPTCLSCQQIVALPGAPIARAAASRAKPSGYAYRMENGPTTSYPTYLADLPAGTDEDALGSKLAAHGVALTTRDALARPRPGTGDSPGARGFLALIIALGLLEVVLLAGAAFAVGARRQVRELGLVAATGGSARDIRRIVLAQGLVLSGLGAVLGVAVGVAVAIGGQSLWERLADSEIAGWEFRSSEIALAAVFGLLSGVAAAVLPALGASRMRPVDALAGRFREGTRSGGARAWAGVVLVVAGVGCGLLASHELAPGFAAYARALPAAAITGRDLQAPSPGGPMRLIVAGSVLAIVGIALLTPALIGWIARAGAGLPLSARLAVRDAERHRHRTGPATSAIAVAVTVSVALTFLLAGSFHSSRVHDQRSLPPRMLAVEPATASALELPRAAKRAAEQLPASRRATLAIPFVPGEKPVSGQPDADLKTLSVIRQDRSCPAALPDHVCSTIAISPGGSLAIGGDDAVTRLVSGPALDAAALSALGAGAVLVFDATMLDRSGHVHVATPRGEVRLAGRLVPRDRTYRQLPAGLISASNARAQGWAVAPGSVLVTYGASAGRDEVDAAVSAAEQAGALAARDSGRDRPENLVLALIAASAAFVTLAGVVVSVALSVAESRADLATLAAVGAQPARRRALTASQALLVGGLGSALGTALGAFIAFTARTTTGSLGFVVPWSYLAVTVIGVPLVAALVAALCTPARLPLVRRAE